jgi:hypothetical protein
MKQKGVTPPTVTCRHLPYLKESVAHTNFYFEAQWSAVRRRIPCVNVFVSKSASPNRGIDLKQRFWLHSDCKARLCTFAVPMYFSSQASKIAFASLQGYIHLGVYGKSHSPSSCSKQNLCPWSVTVIICKFPSVGTPTSSSSTD